MVELGSLVLRLLGGFLLAVGQFFPFIVADERDVVVKLTVTPSAEHEGRPLLFKGVPFDVSISVRGPGAMRSHVRLEYDRKYFRRLGFFSQHSGAHGNVEVSGTEMRLIPTREGKGKIGPAIVFIDGKEYRSEVEELNILPRSDLEKYASHDGRSYETAKCEVKCELSLDKEEIPVGGKATLSAAVWYRGEIDSMTFREPDLSMFTLESRGGDGFEKKKGEREGKRYSVAIKRFEIRGKAPGEYKIGPATVAFSSLDRMLPTSVNLLAGGFFGSVLGSDMQEEVESNTVTLRVKELPAPAKFAAESPAIEIQIDKERAVVGEPLHVEVVFSAEYPIELFAIKDLPAEGAKLRIYRSASSEWEKKCGRFVKSYQFVLQPLSPGTISVGPVELDYLSLKNNDISKLVSNRITISVEGSEETANEVRPKRELGEEKEKAEKVAREAVVSVPLEKRFGSSSLPMLPDWLFILLVIFLLMMTIFGGRIKEGIGVMRNKKKKSISSRLYSSAKKGDAALYSEISSIVYELTKASMADYANLLKLLKGAGVCEKEAREFVSEVRELAERSYIGKSTGRKVNMKLIKKVLEELGKKK